MKTKSEQPAPSASSLRYQRYKSIIDFTSTRTEFCIAHVKSACAEIASPAFVTRVIGELTTDGWIVREATNDGYRWNTDRGEFPASRWLDEKMFGVQIKATPEQTRPREKLLACGAEQLSNAELFAILIRSGRPGESAVMGGEKLARNFHQRLKDLPNAGRAELKEISCAIEKTAYCQILAGIELGRRVSLEMTNSAPVKIRGADDAIAFCRRAFARLAADGVQEEFHIVTLDTKHQVINTHRVTVGTLDASLVHPREVFRPAIRDAAASVILVHNHPSGDCTPSREDRAVTQRLESAGELLGIDVLDHIIVGQQAAVSLRQES